MSADENRIQLEITINPATGEISAGLVTINGMVNYPFANWLVNSAAEYLAQVKDRVIISRADYNDYLKFKALNERSR